MPSAPLSPVNFIIRRIGNAANWLRRAEANVRSTNDDDTSGVDLGRLSDVLVNSSYPAEPGYRAITPRNPIRLRPRELSGSAAAWSGRERRPFRSVTEWGQGDGPRLIDRNSTSTGARATP